MPTGVYKHKKGYKLPEEWRKKISEGNKGKKLSAETRAKISKANKGRKLSAEHKAELSKTHKRIGSGKRLNHKKGKESANWKGENADFPAIHNWIVKKLGRPKKCELCGIEENDRVYHWSNKDHKYSRAVEDWQRVCVPCHRKYDIMTGLVNIDKFKHSKTKT